MNFREYYRPKLPRNKYGAISKNHLIRGSSSTATYSLRSMTQEVIHLNMLLDKDESTEGDIIIETESEEITSS